MGWVELCSEAVDENESESNSKFDAEEEEVLKDNVARKHIAHACKHGETEAHDLGWLPLSIEKHWIGHEACEESCYIGDCRVYQYISLKLTQLKIKSIVLETVYEPAKRYYDSLYHSFPVLYEVCQLVLERNIVSYIILQYHAALYFLLKFIDSVFDFLVWMQMC